MAEVSVSEGQQRIRSSEASLKRMLALVLILVLMACAASEAAEVDVEEIVFAVRQPGAGGHWYENFGYYVQDVEHKVYGAMGRLCKLDVENWEVTVLVDDLKGTVRDPHVHYSGEKILFSYRLGGTEHFNLYEIGADGSGLRRLTSGPYDDLEPVYLPNGQIMFCSSRAKRWVPCWYTEVAILHVCDGDGRNVRPISANVEHDNTPWMLPDGRVIYERWEYVDRSRVGFHHLWTANPDGTGQMVYYGNMHPHTLMIDAKPIPGSEDKVVAVFSPGHGRREHEGAVTIVSPKRGPDELSAARRITEGKDYRDPYPLSEDCFLVAQGAKLLKMDGEGKTELIYQLDPELARKGAQCHEPRPLRARKREPVIPARSDTEQATGRLILQDVHVGRNMEGVKRGEIKKLLVLEPLPKPVNYSGKMPPISFGGTYLLERILGTVPVEEDGSAYMEVPALRSLFFVALDENNNSVKRMHSFLTVLPGETTSCVGCHERRLESPPRPGQGTVMAMRREPSRITPIAGIPEVFDYPRDIQPILDKHCVSCHDYDQRSGGVILTGDHGPIYSHSYFTLTQRQLISDGRDRMETNLRPRSVGTSASPLMKMLDGSHYEARLSQHEQDMIRYWIESAAPYPGTYAAMGTGMIGGFPKSQLDNSSLSWSSSEAASEAIRRRCVSCHDKRSLPVPWYLSDSLGLVLSNPDPNDIRIRYSRHLMFNLSHPEKSLILLAPLSKKAGGYGLCRERDKNGRMGRHVTVFANTRDRDYKKILAMCVDGKEYLAEENPRFDMPGFRPQDSYVRELQRYGILPADVKNDGSIDVYAAERAYWRSFWWKPESGVEAVGSNIVSSRR